MKTTQACAGLALLHILHHCGKSNVEQVRQAYAAQQLDENVEVVEFIDDMAAQYQWADMIVCESGSTVSEVAAAGEGVFCATTSCRRPSNQKC